MTSTGDAIIHLPRPRQKRWTARFVLPDGTEVAAASPVHELVAWAVVLVPDDTGPLGEADAYRATVTSAGFAVSGPTTNADGSACFSIDASPNGDIASATVMVQQASDAPVDGALTVSVNITYPPS